MFGKLACAARYFLAPRPTISLDRPEPSAPGPRCPPRLLESPLEPHAAKNPVSSCTHFPQKSNWESAASIDESHSSVWQRPPVGLPAVDIHPRADRAPAAECADRNKDSLP